MTLDLANPSPNPGDGLRDEAANLLATRFGTPTREKMIEGKKVDLSFVRKMFGRDETLIVEAKDLGHNLGRDELVHIAQDYNGPLNKTAPSTLLVVTRRGLTSQAQAFIDSEPRLRHQTIWELENEMIGLTDYIRSLAKLFDQDGLSTYYVPGRAKFAIWLADGETRTLSDGTVDAIDTIQAWIASDDSRPMAVLGGYGAGKTSLAKQVVSAQAAEALKNPLARRPILIGLGAVSRYTGVEGLLAGMFTYEFPVEGFNVHHLLAVNDKGRLLMVLDGFDEMKHAMTWTDFRSQIASLNRLTKGQAKVLLLGRPSAFISTEEHVHVLRGVKRHADGWRRLPDWPEFQELDLEAFTPAERATFVEGYLRHRMAVAAPGMARDENWIGARAAEVNRVADHDPEMFGKPVHAKILTDLAADPNVDLQRFEGGVSRWELYETFFASLAERETDKDARRPISEKVRLDFLREVAFWLWSTRGGATDFHAEDLPDWLVADLPGDAADQETLKREYLTGSFLEKKGGDIFYFGHRSFAEFLVADRMVRTPPTGDQQAVYSSLLRDGVELFLREAPQRDVFRSWAETLPQAQGIIHFEYLTFIAETFGGPSELRQALPPGARWTSVLAAFGEEITFSEAMRYRLLAEMRTANIQDFALLFVVLCFYGASPALAPDTLGWSVRVAALLLERVFRTATVDGDSGRAKIEESEIRWRTIATNVLPELSPGGGDRQLSFRGPQLVRQMATILSGAQVDLASQSIMARVSFGNDEDLWWDDVLDAMSEEAAEKAQTYFRRQKSLGGVFAHSSSKLKPERGEQVRPRRS